MDTESFEILKTLRVTTIQSVTLKPSVFSEPAILRSVGLSAARIRPRFLAEIKDRVFWGEYCKALSCQQNNTFCHIRFF